MRSMLINSYIERAEFDKIHSKILCKEHYSADLQTLPIDLASKFVQMGQDEATDAFLNQSYEKSDWLVTQMFHLLAAKVLSYAISKTSINGLLGRGSMFIFSAAQFRQLLRVDENWKANSLLDIGAGDGNVTEQMVSLFEHIYVTEKSAPMCWRLNRKFHLLTADTWMDHAVEYDAIACLNVLDRCSHPVTLLNQMRRKLARNGFLILAFAYPFCPYVEMGESTEPVETLAIEGETFEEQAQSFAGIMKPLGFELFSFTKLPYLCEGDLSAPYYLLDDSIFVFKLSE